MDAAAVDVLIPVKDFAQAKERLTPLLPREARAELARVMFLDVLEALSAAAGVRCVWVVSASSAVLDLAAEYQVRGVLEPPRLRGLNPALEFGRAAVISAAKKEDSPFAALLVIPADVPGARPSTFEPLVTGLGPDAAVRICAARDGGTNALLLKPPAAIPFSYGPGSAALHEQAALECGIRCEHISAPGLAIDLDTPDDVRQWLRAARVSRTATLLRRLLTV